MFRGPRKFLISILGVAAVIIGVFFFGFQGQKSDAEASRLFMTHVAAGEMPQAYALLHPAVTDQYSVAQIGDMLDGMAAYTQIEFPSTSFSTSNGTRTTELTGTGTTDSGCESELQFTLVNGQITAFDITPLCRAGASDA